VIAGYDPMDSTSARVPTPDYLAGLTGDVKGIRCGLPREAFQEGLHPEVRSSIERAADDSAKVAPRSRGDPSPLDVQHIGLLYSDDGRSVVESGTV